jgi:hypothetical protein
MTPAAIASARRRARLNGLTAPEIAAIVSDGAETRSHAAPDRASDGSPVK